MVSKYDDLQWDRLFDFKEKLPTEFKDEFRSIYEDQLIAKISLQAALDAADTGACSVATAFVMRCASWLSSSDLSREVRTTTKDLPFDGLSLFSIKTDETFEFVKRLKNPILDL